MLRRSAPQAMRWHKGLRAGGVPARISATLEERRETLSAIDFSRSYMRWFHEGNNVRILIDAACTLIDEATGKSDSYYLIAPCRGEYTHEDGQLIKMPSYEYCGIWGERDQMTIRTHWVSDRDNRTYSARRNVLHIRRFSRSRNLYNNAAVVRATIDSIEPMVCRTTLRDEKRGLRAVLEYPCNTMNVKESPMRFQVDTGPLIVPDFNSQAEHAVERFEVGYVVWNRYDEAQFVLRKPVAISAGAKPARTTDYSEVVVMPAYNEVILAEAD